MNALETASWPLVTVLVVCFNHARFVVEALNSVRAQNCPNLQLIVADDCSSDDSVNVIRGWLAENWPDAVFLAHAKNIGLCRTLNEMLGYAQGKYVSCLAADDAWVADKLRVQVQQMEAFPENVGVLYSDAYQIDENGRLLPGLFIESHRKLASMPDGWVFDILAEGNFVPAMTALIRRRCFAKVGNYDEDLYFEDWDMWLRISRQFQFKFSPHISANYRILSTSMTRSQPRKMGRESTRILAKCAAQGWLKPEATAWINHLEAADALKDYLDSCPERFRGTSAVVRRQPTLRNLLLFAFCHARVPPAAYHRLVSTLKWCIGRRTR